MTTFWDAVAQQPPLPDPVTPQYRVYYNKETGEIIAYSQEDLPHAFLEITAAEFAESRYTMVVKNGVLMDPLPSTQKYVKSVAETLYCTAPDNIMIVASTGQFWKVKEYYNE